VGKGFCEEREIPPWTVKKHTVVGKKSRGKRKEDQRPGEIKRAAWETRPPERGRGGGKKVV